MSFWEFTENFIRLSFRHADDTDSADLYGFFQTLILMENKNELSLAHLQ